MIPRNPARIREYIKAGHAQEGAQAGRMITVATCNHPMHAQLLKSVLEDSGIPVLIANEHSAQTMPHLILAMGGIKLQVSADHEETALALIADFEAAAGGHDTFPPTVC